MKICSKCRQVLQNTEQFCTRCGSIRFLRVDNNEEYIDLQSNTQIPPQQRQPQQMQPQQRPSQQRPSQQRPPQQGPSQQRPPQQGQPQQRPPQQRQPQQRPPQQRPPQQRPPEITCNKEENYIEQQYEKYEDSNIIDNSSVKDWLLTLIFLIIPVYNIIFIIKSLKNTETPAYKRNYLKAFIIYFGVAFTISMIISIAFTSVIVNMLI